MKVAIVYGWSEGSWHSKKLRAAIKKAGFGFTLNPSKADIIIAHSGGCLLVPEKNQAKRIYLIGLPIWTEKNIFRSLHEKISLEPIDTYWLRKSLYNTVYLLTKLPRWIQMHTAWKKQHLPDHSKAYVILVRNKNDTFANHQESLELAKLKGWKYVEIEGQHDDLWKETESIIKLLQSV